jgi:F-type H+-transporting ATPase subunit b
MRAFLRITAALAVIGLAFAALPARADEDVKQGEQHETAEHAHEEAAAAQDAHGEPGEHGEHGEAHEHEQAFNWADGFLGEKDGVEPSLLYRPKGTPPPFLANVVNAAVLFWILISAGKKPVAEALKKRKERLIGAMEEAGRMKAEAQATLSQYEERLKHLDEEIARIRREMHEAAEVEQKRVLTEAKERRARMEKDAALLVEQERKGAREALIRETVNGALKSAEELLKSQVGQADKDRLSKDFLATIRSTPIAVKGAVS